MGEILYVKSQVTIQRTYMVRRAQMKNASIWRDWADYLTKLLLRYSRSFLSIIPAQAGIQSTDMLRARESITPHFRFPSSGHLEPIFTRKILNVGFATSVVLLPQIDPICLKSGREFWEGMISRALREICPGW